MPRWACCEIKTLFNSSVKKVTKRGNYLDDELKQCLYFWRNGNNIIFAVQTRPPGYKTAFMLNTTGYGILRAHKKSKW